MLRSLLILSLLLLTAREGRCKDFIDKHPTSDAMGDNLAVAQSQLAEHSVAVAHDKEASSFDALGSEGLAMIAEVVARTRDNSFQPPFRVEAEAFVVQSEPLQPSFWVEGEDLPDPLTARDKAKDCCVNCDGRTICDNHVITSCGVCAWDFSW